MNYKLAYSIGCLKSELYFSTMREALGVLAYVKRSRGVGRVFKRGKDGQFKEVIAS